MGRSKVCAALSVMVAVTLTISACSSSKKTTTPSASNTGSATATGSGSTSSTPGPTIKIGVITDLTGPSASGWITTEKGIKAYVNAVNAAGGVNGQKLSYVVRDTTSTPAGALLAAQQLVQTDKVFAIIAVGSDFFGASAYTLKQGIPVVGAGIDGPEWSMKVNTNLFTVNGASNAATAYAPLGQYMKSKGVTSCGSIGYIESPSATAAVSAFAKSCVAAGLKSGYTTGVHFGSTDMAPVALAMKAAKVDGVWLAVVPSTGFALAAAIRQIGLTPKAFLLADGYGGDLLESSAAVTAAQGFQFSPNAQPVEANTPATQIEVKNFAAVGVTQTPTFAEQTSYLSVVGLVAGLKAAGPEPTRAKFMSSLRAISDFDADGLLAPEKIDFNNYDPSNLCVWVVTLQAKKFIPDAGSPFCGGKV
jgi:branched-chain amino acid transport system substrate-binding protein